MRLTSIFAAIILGASASFAEIWMSPADEHTVSTSDWSVLDPVPITNGGVVAYTTQDTFDWIDDNWPEGALTSNSILTGVVYGTSTNLDWSNADPLTNVGVSAATGDVWETAVTASVGYIYYPTSLVNGLVNQTLNHDPYSNYYIYINNVDGDGSYNSQTVTGGAASVGIDFGTVDYDPHSMWTTNAFFPNTNGVWAITAGVNFFLDNLTGTPRDVRAQIKYKKNGSLNGNWLDREGHKIVTRDVLTGDIMDYAVPGDAYLFTLDIDGGDDLVVEAVRFSAVLMHANDEP